MAAAAAATAEPASRAPSKGASLRCDCRIPKDSEFTGYVGGYGTVAWKRPKLDAHGSHYRYRHREFFEDWYKDGVHYVAHSKNRSRLLTFDAAGRMVCNGELVQPCQLQSADRPKDALRCDCCGEYKQHTATCLGCHERFCPGCENSLIVLGRCAPCEL